MSNSSNAQSEQQVVNPVRSSRLKRKWYWLAILAFLGFFCLLLGCFEIWNQYQEEQFNSFLKELGYEGVNTEWTKPFERDLAEKRISATLTGNQITSATVMRCTRLPNVERLTFINTPNISDASLSPLVELKSLQYLDLDNTSITGDGFPPLDNLPNLKTISLGKCRLTESGVERLLKCRQLEITQENKLPSIKLQSFEANVTARIAGEGFTKVYFRILGTFTSSHFIPMKVGEVFFPQFSRPYLSGGEHVTVVEKGVYLFDIRVEGYTGHQKITLAVALTENSKVWFSLGEIEIDGK